MIQLAGVVHTKLNIGAWYKEDHQLNEKVHLCNKMHWGNMECVEYGSPRQNYAIVHFNCITSFKATELLLWAGLVHILCENV